MSQTAVYVPHQLSFFPIYSPHPKAKLREIHENPAVAHILQSFYPDVHALEYNSVHLRNLYSSISHYLDSRMPHYQRKRLFYAAGKLQYSLGNHDLSVAHLTRAADIEVGMHPLNTAEAIDLAALYLERGFVNRAMSRYPAAEHDFRDALPLFRRYAGELNMHAEPFELKAISCQATMLVVLGKYDEVHSAIRSVRAISDRVNPARLEIGTLHWAEALSYQGQRQFAKAWEHAEIAATIYKKFGVPASCVRIYLVAAEIALSRAQECGAKEKAYWLDQARRYHKIACQIIDHSPDVDDVNGCVALHLNIVRLNRVSGTHSTHQRQHDIKRLLDDARKLRDIPVQIKALTALGEEIASNEGGMEAARKYYGQAISLAEGAGMPGVAAPAYRARSLDGEWNVPPSA